MTSPMTARYVRTQSGYMGQLLEWPEVVTEGRSLDDCRTSLIDAAHEMALAYREMGKDIPVEPALFESLVVEIS